MTGNDRPIYSDVGMFTRGRSGYRPDPHPDGGSAVWLGLGLAVILAFLFVMIVAHFAGPVIR